MTESPSTRAQLHNAIPLAALAITVSDGGASTEDLHAEIHEAADRVGGLPQLCDALATLAGALIVVIADQANKPIPETVAYVEQMTATMPGLD